MFLAEDSEQQPRKNTKEFSRVEYRNEQDICRLFANFFEWQKPNKTKKFFMSNREASIKSLLPESAGSGVEGDPRQLLPAVKLFVAAAAVAVVSGIAVADPVQGKNALKGLLTDFARGLKNHLQLRSLVY